MHYRQVSTAASLLFFVLFGTLVSAPEIVYWLFQLQQNDAGDFLSKRAGMLFLGLSILCFYMRNTISTELENAVALSLGAAMGAMALLGVYELARGNTGPGILIAVIVEFSIAALFFRLWFRNRPTA